MPDRPVPKCPGCGKDMELQESTVVNYWYSCDCGWSSPLEDTPERAYAAAMQRAKPENKVLTTDELKGRTKPVWVEIRNAAPWINEGGYYCLCDHGTIMPPSGISFKAGERDWLFLDRKPTNADIAAARKEQP